MKKQYSKPGIIIENFELSQYIAYGCGAAHKSEFGGPLIKTKEECAWGDPFGDKLFIDMNICDNDPGDTAGVCYNNPEGGMNIFNS